ncbi:hypothetical protein HUG15_13665 [Salicibibacter cibarius]|uniref:Yip1 domain-containing protein n=1 Tax=Salicibibacter cibarius TaxID=2743000 RepID=A0A7T6Z448_9BACI|nr:hypothetical protein [Salicibibacter cibarius]QQK76510.1 hypothetical protein HUG15_13665 [Salicibibacter cibarius]
MREAEEIKGSLWRLIGSALLIGVLTGLSMYLLSDQVIAAFQRAGVSAEEASAFITLLAVLIGIFVAGISVIAVLVAALIFWGFFKDIGLKNLLLIFTYFLPIYVLVLLIDFPFLIYFEGLEGRSMTSLGFMAEQIWDQPFFVAFFSQVSLLFIWCFLVQLFAIKVNTTKSTRYIVTVSAIAYVIVMTIIAGISMLGMGQGVVSL